MNRPQPPFLAAKEDAAGCTWQIVGLPYDGTSSYRRGSRFGPTEIRKASDSIETYSPYCQRDLEELNPFDAGDLELDQRDPDEVVKIIADYYRDQTRQGHRILGIGGEHTVTIGAVRGLMQEGIKPYVLYLDAHFDLREEYSGGRNSHACAARRIADILGAERLVQWGMRSGQRAEFEWADKQGTFAGRDLPSLHEACRRLQGEPVYFTLDLDIFDPAELPGVGNPEPGGLTFGEFVNILKELEHLNIVGADVVELSPVWDLSGRSAVMSAEIVRELLLAIAK